MRGGRIGFIASIAAVVCVAVVSAGEVVVRPESATGPLDNPLKGWCPYTDAGPIHQPYSMVFLSVPWKKLEPEEGRYAFEQWERRDWSVPAAQGKHVVLRVYIDYPSKPSGLPDWLKDQVKSTPYTDHGGGVSPDYDNPRMVAAMESLIAAMGRRYDGTRVAFLELGLLGFWGECIPGRDALYAKPETERPGDRGLPAGLPEQDLDGPLRPRSRRFSAVARLPRRPVSAGHRQRPGLVVPRRTTALGATANWSGRRSAARWSRAGRDSGSASRLE